jgi:hypothetical protein
MECRHIYQRRKTSFSVTFKPIFWKFDLFLIQGLLVASNRLAVRNGFCSLSSISIEWNSEGARNRQWPEAIVTAVQFQKYNNAEHRSSHGIA